MKKLEHQIHIAESDAKRQYTLLHESLEREHSRTVDTLKQEMMELRAKHKRATESLKKEYSKEKSKWKKETEAALKMQQQQRTYSASSTQVKSHRTCYYWMSIILISYVNLSDRFYTTYFTILSHIIIKIV